jgi:hypothetical protein
MMCNSDAGFRTNAELGSGYRSSGRGPSLLGLSFEAATGILVIAAYLMVSFLNCAAVSLTAPSPPERYRLLA